MGRYLLALVAMALLNAIPARAQDFPDKLNHLDRSSIEEIDARGGVLKGQARSLYVVLGESEPPVILSRIEGPAGRVGLARVATVLGEAAARTLPEQWGPVVRAVTGVLTQVSWERGRCRVVLEEYVVTRPGGPVTVRVLHLRAWANPGGGLHKVKVALYGGMHRGIFQDNDERGAERHVAQVYGVDVQKVRKVK